MKKSDSASYTIPLKKVRQETWVLNSKFITTLKPVFSVEEAKNFIIEVRNEFSDASHNVPVYIIGHGNTTILHCNDDGEPPGTAGRPALEVLKGSGIGDVAVVITRYFGGKKLGINGLVHAYKNAVKSILEITPLAEKMPVHVVLQTIPYQWLENVRFLVEINHGLIIEETYAEEIKIKMHIPVTSFEKFKNEIYEMSKGREIVKSEGITEEIISL